jgi:Spy/CpxP family protein refolding chaperone
VSGIYVVFRGLLGGLLGGLLLLATVSVSATAQGGPPDAARRDSLEARVRARMAVMLRNQVGLNDEQVRRLQQTSRRFDGQRRTLFEQERQVREDLRSALVAGDSAADAQVAALLDRTIQVQRERLDLLEAEQRELASFLTPRQRARLFGLEEQMRRRLQDLQDARTPPPGPRRGLPVNPPVRRPPGLR